jgi:hypothetical protein
LLGGVFSGRFAIIIAVTIVTAVKELQALRPPGHFALQLSRPLGIHKGKPIGYY